MFSATPRDDHRRVSLLIRKFPSSRITSQVDTDGDTRISGELPGYCARQTGLCEVVSNQLESHLSAD